MGGALNKEPMKQANIIVRFNSLNEFVDELKYGTIVDGVLRSTKVFKQISSYPMQDVSVVATALRRSGDIVQIVRLSIYCGQVATFDKDPSHCKTIVLADAEIKRLAEVAVDLGLNGRAGIYEHFER